MKSAHKTATPMTASGFSLLEMLVALMIMGSVLAWGLPRLEAVNRHTALVSEINRLQSASALARNTAITQRMDVTLCPANASRSACIKDWSAPIMVVKGGDTSDLNQSDIVRIFPQQAGTWVTYSRGWRRVGYTPLGYTSGFNGSFVICTDSPQGTRLVLSQLGRLRIDEAPLEC